jgi:hypothetical protein
MRLLLCGAARMRRGPEGLAMTGNAKVWFGKAWFSKVGLLGRSDLATQATVLLPVVAIAGLTAWMMLSAPTSAKGQSAQPYSTAVAVFPPLNPASAAAEAAAPTLPEAARSDQAAPSESAATSGLKISAQSWRRGGLGSNALVTFTLRNDNAYAVKDIEIACAFARQDGSHLTDRKRVIPDAVVNMKSRKTFARLHIGYVNIYANKAKCAAVAASRI